MFSFSIYLAKSKYYDDRNKLVVGKKEDDAAVVAIKEFFGLKPKMYTFLADDISEHYKAIISQHTDVLLNQKCFRHSMNRIKSKNQRIGTDKVNKISLSCFDDKTHILNNWYDRLVLDY